MSKNTGTSELINYFDLGANGDVGIAGSLDINTIANATTDTDTFLVSDTGIIKYRTGAQILSDIGGQVAGNYVTTDTSQAITANKSFTVGFSLGSEGSGNQTSFFRNTSSLFSGSGGTNIFGFNSSNNIYFGKGLNNGGVLQWNNTTATRYYTLPDADGTLALTSSLSGYLPLTGGTLTGALNGTSITLSGDYNSTSNSGSLLWSGATNKVQLNANAGTLDFYTGTSGYTKQLSISPTGAATFSSSVGVGVSPATALDVNGTINVRTNGFQFGRITTNNVSGDTGGLNLQYIEAGTFKNGIVLNGGGNVGIGTTTINSERLTVAQTTANASALLVYTTGVAAGQSYGATIIGGTNASDASFRVFNQGASTNYFTVLGNGNVGIGTPTPTSGKLVVSDASSTKIYIAGGSSQNGMTWEAVGGANSFYLFNGTISSAGWGIYNVNTATFPFFATNGGNVLIGTTTVDSGQKLQVNGTAATSGNLTSATLLVRNASNSQTIVGIGNRSWWTGGASDNDAAIGTYSPNMCFFTNNSGTERVRINSSGDLIVTGTVANISILGDGAQMHFGRNNTNYIIANGGTSSTIRIISNTNGVELSNGATSWVAVSDENLKEMSEWKPFENSVEKILSLRAGTSRYKTDKEGTSRSFLIAQDVKYILPEAVSEYEDGTLGLRYTEVIPMLVAAIQEQQQQIQELKNK